MTPFKKKTGTLEDWSKPLSQVVMTPDRATQDLYLPAIDAALHNLPRRERNKAGPLVVDSLLVAEAKHLDALTNEGVHLTATKLDALTTAVFGGRPPRQSLSHASATQISQALRSVSDQYLETWRDQHK